VSVDNNNDDKKKYDSCDEHLIAFAAKKRDPQTYGKRRRTKTDSNEKHIFAYSITLHRNEDMSLKNNGINSAKKLYLMDLLYAFISFFFAYFHSIIL
jgi:hypothetical protein